MHYHFLKSGGTTHSHSDVLTTTHTQLYIPSHSVLISQVGHVSNIQVAEVAVERDLSTFSGSMGSNFSQITETDEDPTTSTASRLDSRAEDMQAILFARYLAYSSELHHSDL